MAKSTKDDVEECSVCLEIADAGKTSQPPQLSHRGKIMLGASGAVFAGISALLVPFVFPGLRKIALPFIPASAAQIQNVLTALRGRSGSLLDIGSGDGRIVSVFVRFYFIILCIKLSIP